VRRRRLLGNFTNHTMKALIEKNFLINRILTLWFVFPNEASIMMT
jgi:hypothetical protein